MGGSEPDWSALSELSQAVSTARHRAEALSVLAGECDRLIPADRGAALFTMRGGVPWCICCPDFPDNVVRDFNSHFNRRVPVHFSGHEPVLGPVDWERYPDAEYVADFHRPLGIHQSVGASFYDTYEERLYVLWVHRNGLGRQFTPGEVETLRVMCTTIGTIVSLKSEIDALRREAICEAELGPEADVLSKREAEIARLICRRLSMREIAETLHISRRTVEHHACHIYNKLHVANRKELAGVLLRRIHDW